MNFSSVARARAAWEGWIDRDEALLREFEVAEHQYLYLLSRVRKEGWYRKSDGLADDGPWTKD